MPNAPKDLACDVTRQQVDLVKDEKTKQDTVRVAINVPYPTPHQITPSMVGYLFNKADVEQGGKYLGEFTVVAVADKQVQLQPSKKLSEAEVAALRASQGPWILYDTLLTDDHEVFQDYDGLEKLLKTASLPEYQQDGKPINPNNKESAKNERKLRDYGVLFQEYHHQYSLWVEAMAAVMRDQQFIKAALDGAQEQVKLRHGESPSCKRRRSTRSASGTQWPRIARPWKSSWPRSSPRSRTGEEQPGDGGRDCPHPVGGHAADRRPDPEDGPGGQMKGMIPHPFPRGPVFSSPAR